MGAPGRAVAVFVEELERMLEHVAAPLGLSVAVDHAGTRRWLARQDAHGEPPGSGPPRPWSRARPELSDEDDLAVLYRADAPGGVAVVQGFLRAATRLEELRAPPRRPRARTDPGVLETELEIAGKIQETLLFGQAPGDLTALELATFGVPSRQVGGDFFDFHVHGRDQVDVVIGDVMGKGVPAALVGTAVKGQFLRFTRGARAGDPSHHGQPATIVGQVHDAVAAQLLELDTFVTACYLRFDVAAARLVFVDCGHTHTLLWRAGTGRVERLRDDLPPGVNLPLGIDPATRFEQTEVALAPGDLVLLYSDGLTEALGPGGARFGVDALAAALEAHGSLPPEQVLENLRARTEGHEVRDDLACVAVRVLRVGGDRMAVESLPARLARVRAFLREECEAHASEKELADLELAVTEAFTNIVRHAYGGDAGGLVGVEVDAGPGEVVIRLLDRGPPLDPARLHELAEDTPEPADGGYGLFLIHTLTDEVDYARDGDENVLTLRKVLAGAGEDP